MKASLIAVIVATAGLVAVASPAAARCANGYEPAKVQGNWVCRLKTPKLPLKSPQKRSKADQPTESLSFSFQKVPTR
jgi:hypothetical protein